jgi:predicted SprT family Zn-dependent metalloprotease
MHDDFRVSDEIQKIEDYITYKTNETLLKLKVISPNANIEDITISFSRRLSRVNGKYDPRTREFTYNINWIEEFMDNPRFKKDLDETIAHEIAHMIFHDHSQRWKLLCRYLGGTGERTYSNGEFIIPKTQRKYVATCPRCGHIIYKQKAPTEGVIYGCAMCHREFTQKYGKLASRFTFKEAKLDYKPVENIE